MSSANSTEAGLVVVMLISAASFLVWQYYPAVSALMWAFIFSIIIANLVALPSRFKPGIDFASTTLLRGAIAAYGLTISPLVWVKAGYALPVVLVVVFSVFFLGLKIGQRFGLSPELSTLIGVGTCICGASAIAATAPAIKAKDEEAGMALATVTLFGLLAMFVFPLLYGVGLKDLLGGQTAYGVWVGAGVHETAQVIAASSQVGPEAASVALTVKAVRIFMIGPMILVAVSIFNRLGRKEASSRRLFVPTYAIIFIFASILSGVIDFAAEQGYSSTMVKDWPVVKTTVSRYVLPFVLGSAFAGVGLKVRFASLRRTGSRAFIIGSLVAILASALALVLTLIVAPLL
ncbi:MAG: putative sulfate exporter family transporter [Thaumarchaeota archaeon]|nr:putative sulfate exporter family transporter [Nitrososphaerota archaeon]